MIGEEADLDFEVAIPLIYPQKTVLFQTDDEWYQKEMAKAGSVYTGFFNSEAPGLLPPDQPYGGSQPSS